MGSISRAGRNHASIASAGGNEAGLPAPGRAIRVRPPVRARRASEGRARRASERRAELAAEYVRSSSTAENARRVCSRAGSSSTAGRTAGCRPPPVVGHALFFGFERRRASEPRPSGSVRERSPDRRGSQRFPGGRRAPTCKHRFLTVAALTGGHRGRRFRARIWPRIEAPGACT